MSDNGCGVDPSNYEALTAKYHTSKVRRPARRTRGCRLTRGARLQMSKFSDLASLSSFGFRGEALSSLCSLCNLSVVTRTHQQVRLRRARAWRVCHMKTAPQLLARGICAALTCASLARTCRKRERASNTTTTVASRALRLRREQSAPLSF